MEERIRNDRVLSLLAVIIWIDVTVWVWARQPFWELSSRKVGLRPRKRLCCPLLTIVALAAQRCRLPVAACLPRDATLVDGSPCFPGHLLCDEGHLARQDWWQADPLGGLPLLLHLLTLLPFRLVQDGRRQKSWRCQLSDFHPNKVYNLERSAGFDFQLET